MPIPWVSWSRLFLLTQPSSHKPTPPWEDNKSTRTSWPETSKSTDFWVWYPPLLPTLTDTESAVSTTCPLRISATSKISFTCWTTSMKPITSHIQSLSEPLKFFSFSTQSTKWTVQLLSSDTSPVPESMCTPLLPWLLVLCTDLNTVEPTRLSSECLNQSVQNKTLTNLSWKSKIKRKPSSDSDTESTKTTIPELKSSRKYHFIFNLDCLRSLWNLRKGTLDRNRPWTRKDRPWRRVLCHQKTLPQRWLLQRTHLQSHGFPNWHVPCPLHHSQSRRMDCPLEWVLERQRK